MHRRCKYCCVIALLAGFASSDLRDFCVAVSSNPRRRFIRSAALLDLDIPQMNPQNSTEASLWQGQLTGIGHIASSLSFFALKTIMNDSEFMSLSQRIPFDDLSKRRNIKLRLQLGLQLRDNCIARLAVQFSTDASPK